MSSSFYRRQKHDQTIRNLAARGSASSNGQGYRGAGSSQSRERAPDAPSSTAPQRLVYTVTEGRDGKSFWTKIGVGFENQDGSLNLILDALPVNGRLQVRNFEPGADRGDDSSTERAS